MDSYLFNNEKSISDDFYEAKSLYNISLFVYFLNQNRPEVINGYQAYFDEKMLSLFQPDIGSLSEIEYLFFSREEYLLLIIILQTVI